MNLFYEFFGDPLKHAEREKKAHQAKRAQLATAVSNGPRPQQGPMRYALSLILATGAAYAFSFAVDLLLGGLFGVYPNTAFVPVVTWAFISGALTLAACV